VQTGFKSRDERRMERCFIQGESVYAPEPTTAPSGATIPLLTTRCSAPARAGSPREAWLRWLGPRFPEGSAYFTGTYSDDYGFPHGLTLARNVHHDFRRFILDRDLQHHEFIVGVEEHRFRDVLHLHAVIAGDFTDLDRRLLQAEWAVERGHARVLPVLDGCASYVTKYALKHDTTNFDWHLA
jgi:hypothetical protein